MCVYMYMCMYIHIYTCIYIYIYIIRARDNPYAAPLRVHERQRDAERAPITSESRERESCDLAAIDSREMSGRDPTERCRDAHSGASAGSSASPRLFLFLAGRDASPPASSPSASAPSLASWGTWRELESRFQVRFPGIDFHCQSALFILALIVMLTLYSAPPPLSPVPPFR